MRNAELWQSAHETPFHCHEEENRGGTILPKKGIVNRDSSGIKPPIIVAWYTKNRNCEPWFLRNRATSTSFVTMGRGFISVFKSSGDRCGRREASFVRSFRQNPLTKRVAEFIVPVLPWFKLLLCSICFCQLECAVLKIMFKLPLRCHLNLYYQASVLCQIGCAVFKSSLKCCLYVI